jgi:transcriptional regulator with XRE-family HTH domain
MIEVAKRKEIDPTFGRRLREVRKSAGLTQLELGEKAGMHQHAVARLEAGERDPGWSTVRRLASALNVTPNDFLDPNS